MKFDPLKHHRRSIRLKHYDYSREGAYFVTVVTQDRQGVLAEIVTDEIVLTEAGTMVWEIWRAMPTFYPGVEVDACVVMPNHVHGIVVMTGLEKTLASDGQVGSKPGQAPVPAPTEAAAAPAENPMRMSLSEVVHRFKTMTTTRYMAGVHQRGWPGFRKQLWQRYYYEEVIRTVARWNEVRQYIADNPRRWHEDEENLDGRRDRGFS